MPNPRRAEEWATNFFRRLEELRDFPHYTIEQEEVVIELATELLRAYAREREARMRERAEKLACKYCQEGNRMDPARPQTHHAVDFPPGSKGVVYARCRAVGIRALEGGDE